MRKGLSEPDLTCQSQRKMRSDMIGVYKMAHDKIDSDVQSLLSLTGLINIRQTRGNSKILHWG